MMNEMSTNSVRHFGPGFSTGRGFLPRAARGPSFEIQAFAGSNSRCHQYGPPNNFRGTQPPGNYQRPVFLAPGNYQYPPVQSDNYQRPHLAGNYQGPPPFPPNSYREPPLRGFMGSPPQFHRLRGPSGYNDYPLMHGPPFDPNFPPLRRPRMGIPMRRRYKGRRGTNSKPDTWKRVPKEVKEPPVNEWERRENWWNDAIQKAVKEKKLARKRWKATRSSKDWKLYLESKKEAKRKVAQAKAKTFIAMCPEELRASKSKKKVSSLPNDNSSTAEDNSQAKDSEEISATENQGNVSSLSEDQTSTALDVSQPDVSEEISTTEEQENVSSLSEHHDNTTDNAS